MRRGWHLFVGALALLSLACGSGSQGFVATPTEPGTEESLGTVAAQDHLGDEPDLIVVGASEDAAIVGNNFPCVLLGPPRGFLRPVEFDADESHAAIASPRSGKANQSCHGQLPEGVSPPDRTLRVGPEDYRPFTVRCRILPTAPVPPVLTDDWEQVITPAGRVSLRCHVLDVD